MAALFMVIRRRLGTLPATALAASGLLLALCQMSHATDEVAACADLEPGSRRTVTRVVDGETLALDDGTELRLTGALAPRAIDAGAEPGTWPIESAAIQELQTLALGKSVDIRFRGEHSDRYGRLQGHAFLKTDDGSSGWVQGHMLMRGLARAYVFAVDHACMTELLAAEALARESRRGIWAEAAYEIRRADSPAVLLRHLATYQLVEGRIVSVATTRGSIYLNFAAVRRRGFSVFLKQGDRDRLGAYAGNPKHLERLRVRVRGWIGQRADSPVIDLSAGGSLEVIDGAAANDRAGATLDSRTK